MVTRAEISKTCWASTPEEAFNLDLNKFNLHLTALKLPYLPERTRCSKWHHWITITEHMLLYYIREVCTCLSLSAFRVSMTTCSCSLSFNSSSLKVSKSWLLCFSFSIWFCNFSICMERTHQNTSATAWHKDCLHSKSFWRPERNEMGTVAERLNPSLLQLPISEEEMDCFSLKKSSCHLRSEHIRHSSNKCLVHLPAECPVVLLSTVIKFLPL